MLIRCPCGTTLCERIGDEYVVVMSTRTRGRARGGGRDKVRMAVVWIECRVCGQRWTRPAA
jgi:hypothetical protein